MWKGRGDSASGSVCVVCGSVLCVVVCVCECVGVCVRSEEETSERE